MSSDPDASPVNPLPPVVVALALVVFGVELMFLAGERGFVGGPEAVGWRLAAVGDYAFFAQVLDAMIDAGRWPLEHVQRIVTYSFVHLSFIHMLFVCVFLLAIGKMVAEAFGPWAFLGIFFGSAIGGALVFWIFETAGGPLAGGYPAVYGLIGAYTFLLWVHYGQVGAPQVRAFTLIAFLLGIQLIFGLLFGSGQDWIGDVAGFATGFLLSFVLSPGGWERLLEKLRQR